jgi:hypothetical protein
VKDVDATYRLELSANVLCLSGSNTKPSVKSAGVVACLEIELIRDDSLLFWTDEQWKASSKPSPHWRIQTLTTRIGLRPKR